VGRSQGDRVREALYEEIEIEVDARSKTCQVISEARMEIVMRICPKPSEEQLVPARTTTRRSGIPRWLLVQRV